MQYLLYLPAPVSFFIVSAITTFFALAGLYLVRKKYSADVLKENHEVAAIIFNAFGLFYGVMVAFVVFVTWSIKAQCLITASLTVTISLILFLIYVLDHPFTGTSKVSTEPLTQVLDVMQKS
jgi:uncharacterized protein YacL